MWRDFVGESDDLPTEIDLSMPYWAITKYPTKSLSSYDPKKTKKSPKQQPHPQNLPPTSPPAKSSTDPHPNLQTNLPSREGFPEFSHRQKKKEYLSTDRYSQVGCGGQDLNYAAFGL